MSVSTREVISQKNVLAMQQEELLTKEEAKKILGTDYGHNFPENVHDLVKKLYSKRNEEGEPTESLTQVLRRVSVAVAIGRLKYVMQPYDIVRLTLDKAIENPFVLSAAAKYYKAMGERKMFANTPANINASPDISLSVLQYEAHGEIMNWSTHKIWMGEDFLRRKYQNLSKSEKEQVQKWISEVKGEVPQGAYSGGSKPAFSPNVIEKGKHEVAMGYYASKIKRKGGLAACGVTYAGDSIEGIEKAATEIMDATKGSMGMGINTSSIRPWQTPNSDGSTASGPDRFVEKLFCPAGQSIAQGGRRGGAFIELRDSDHPDITNFLSKKCIPEEPNFPDIYDIVDGLIPKVDKEEFMENFLEEAEDEEEDLEDSDDSIQDSDEYEDEEYDEESDDQEEGDEEEYEDDVEMSDEESEEDDDEEYEDDMDAEEAFSEAVKDRELRVMQRALEEFSRASFNYYSKQTYLKNYNISIRAVDGFMDNVEKRHWYTAMFEDKPWKGNLFDFTKPLLDADGNQKINPLNKEPLYELYSISLEEFPEAAQQAEEQGFQVLKSEDGKLLQVKKDGTYCFYAPDIFKRICLGMVRDGEPGIQFADLVEKGNSNNHMYKLNTCNPCGEQNLPAGIGKDGIEYRGICNLTTINAAHSQFWNEEDGSYSYTAMEEVAEVATEFMDDVTTVTHFPIMTQNSTCRRERRNGGGFAGIAEFVARQGLEFGSPESNKLVQELYNKFSSACIRASERLARHRGTYEIWEGSTYSKKGLKVRNCCMVNQQPTGTMAQLCGTSWGPEPFNGIVFSRKVRDKWVKFTAPGFKEAMEKVGAWPGDEEDVKDLLQKISANGKKVTGLDEVPEEIQRAFKINTEIDPYDYIDHLGAIQNGVSDHPECFNALSNTCVINGDVNWQYAWDAVMMGYKLGVKSITFYPDGTRLSQPVEATEEKVAELEKLLKFVPQDHLPDIEEEEDEEEYEEEDQEDVEAEDLSTSETEAETEATTELETEEDEEVEEEEAETEEEVSATPAPRVRPKRLFGFNEEILTPEGPVHVHVYFDEKGPRQIFANLLRGGGVMSGNIEAICRMATKALKWGCSPEDVANGLINIQGGQKIVGMESCSIPDAIGKVLLEACKCDYTSSAFPEYTEEEIEDEYETEQAVSVDSPSEVQSEDSETASTGTELEEKIVSLDDKVKLRMGWIAEGHATQCPVCSAEFSPDSFGNPACKSGPVCNSCGWSHCG